MHLRSCSVRLSNRRLLKKYNLLDLSSRRLQRDAMMLYDLSHNKYDYAALIGMSCDRAPYRAQQRGARPHRLLAVNRCRAAAGPRSPPRRRTHNTLFNAIDIIASTLNLCISSFKTKNMANTLNCAFYE
ncbi:hypothetical protein EVAR_86077_1 [Eumeta japonica]|uniref:Uncharacterized protein n=1 Tax=Eumeta variegata TaxID=151549 RepID=A0A4C1UJC9_EUMVA|nr:hypothetical protein EVAR_86077_1 [Eumeta japonica]